MIRLRAVCMLALAALPSSLLQSQTPSLSPLDAARLEEVSRMMLLRKKIWKGWERTPLTILLVTDSVEYLLGHSKAGSEFSRARRDSLFGESVWTRSRVFPPTLLATFPAVGGMPTIVVGTAEHTGKSSTEWVLTLLHEHFHEWQYSMRDYYRRVAKLDLSGGDSTGAWMLNYPFPYDSPPVETAAKQLAQAVSSALDAPPEKRKRAVAGVVRAREALAKQLTPAENRYMEFQLWQEGVARYIEYKAARLADRLGAPTAAFRALPDFESYQFAAERMALALRRELDGFDLGQNRRVSFYPLGAALALLLDATRSDWKRQYAAKPFETTPLLRKDH
jgi:hypothetical protein